MVPRVCTSVVAVVEFLSETCAIWYTLVFQNLCKTCLVKPNKKRHSQSSESIFEIKCLFNLPEKNFLI